MIALVTTAPHAYTVRPFLRSWRPDLIGAVALLAYEKLADATAPPAAAYVFTDLERMTAAGLRWAAEAAGRLQAAGARVLNAPGRALDRVSLLHVLGGRGVNAYAVHELDALGEARFPVFLRSAWDHSGPLTELLPDAAAVASEGRRLAAAGVPVAELVATEYCETRSGDGLYWNHSAFFIAGRVIPRRRTATPTWETKYTSVAPMVEGGARAELAFQRSNPHAAWVREVFATAGVEFGRVDYRLRDGRPQAWEVNTNPLILWPREHYLPDTQAAQGWFADQLAGALLALADRPAAGPTALPALPAGAFRGC